MVIIKPVMQKLYHIFLAVTPDMRCKHSVQKEKVFFIKIPYSLAVDIDDKEKALIHLLEGKC